MSGITLAGVFKGAPAPSMYNTAPALHTNTTNGLHLVTNGAGNGGPPASTSIPTNLGNYRMLNYPFLQTQINFNNDVLGYNPIQYHYIIYEVTLYYTSYLSRNLPIIQCQSGSPGCLSCHCLQQLVTQPPSIIVPKVVTRMSQSQSVTTGFIMLYW